MPSSRFLRILLVAPVALGLLLLTPGFASADDDEPAPKRMRVMIKKRAAPNPAPQGDPMKVLHDWFVRRLETQTPDAKTMQDRFAAWFSGGSDVPLAGLRDAFKAQGWDAKTLGTWLSGHMQRVPAMARSFSMQGPDAHGWFRARGPHLGSMQSHAAPQPGAACPQCGHGAQAHHGFGHAPLPHGRMMGPFGMRGRMGPRGFARGPWGMRGHGMGGQGMRGFGGRHGHALRGPGFGGQRGGALGGMGPGRTHTQSKAYIMWNDGNGWQRREIAPGAGFGALPFGGNRGGGNGFAWHGPFGHGQAGHGQAGHGSMPKPGPGHGGVDAQQLQKILEALKSMPRGGAGKPGAAGQPGQPGAVGGMDPQQLQHLMELLKQLRQPGQGSMPNHGIPGVHVVPGMLKSFQEMLKQLEQQKQDAAAGPAPKRVRIKASAPKELDVVEETEIK